MGGSVTGSFEPLQGGGQLGKTCRAFEVGSSIQRIAAAQIMGFDFELTF